MVATVALIGAALVVAAAPVGAQTAGLHLVGVVTETFVDKTRPTAANGD